MKNCFLFSLLSVSILLISGCFVKNDNAHLENKKFRYLASNGTTECAKDIDTWPMKIKELEHQITCSTADFKDCLYSMQTDRKKESSSIKYLSLLPMSLTGPYIHKAIRMPSIWSLLPPKPPTGPIQNPLTQTLNYVTDVPLNSITPEELRKNIETFRDAYSKSAVPDLETMSANINSDARSTISNIDKVHESLKMAKDMVKGLAENVKFTQMDNTYLDNLVLEMNKNPVRFAETLTQFSAMLEEKIAIKDTYLLKALEGVGNDDLKRQLLYRAIEDSDQLAKEAIKSSELAKQFPLEQVQQLDKDKLVAFAEDMAAQLQKFESMLSLINEQIGRVVHSKGFSKLPGTQKFFSYFYYRKMLTALNALTDFHLHIKSPHHIAKSIAIYSYYAQSPIRIHGKLNPKSILLDFNKNTHTFLNNAANFDKITADKFKKLATKAYKLGEALKSPELLLEINAGLTRYGKALEKSTSFNNMSILKEVADVFINYAKSDVKPNTPSAVALKTVAVFVKKFTTFFTGKGIELLARQLKRTVSLKSFKTSLVGRFMSKLIAAAPTLGLSAILLLADYEFYYFLYCSYDNYKGKEYKEYFYNSCSNIAAHYVETDEINALSERMYAFSNIDPLSPTNNLNRQLEILSESKRVCKYMDRSYYNLVEKNKVQCLKVADPNGEGDDIYTHGYIGDVRFNLLLEQNKRTKKFDPSIIEVKSESKRNENLILKNYEYYKASDLGVENYYRLSSGNKTLLDTTYLGPRKKTENQRSILSAARVFKIKGAMRSLVKHHYCCNKDASDRLSPEECVNTYCNSSNLASECTDKPVLNWTRNDLEELPN